MHNDLTYDADPNLGNFHYLPALREARADVSTSFATSLTVTEALELFEEYDPIVTLGLMGNDDIDIVDLDDEIHEGSFEIEFDEHSQHVRIGSRSTASLIFTVGDVTMWLSFGRAHSGTAGHISACGPSHEVITDAIATITERLPAPPPPPEEKTRFTFWNLGGMGSGNRRSRIVEVPEWADIRNNYSQPVRDELETLFQRTKNQNLNSGQLILWHGEPGTGKTYAIRALANEWKKWADFHYIVDPDAFFGHSPEYMMGTLLDNNSRKWRVFVVEDSGELLSQDAKARSGQGLSRLLNTVDGMIGQGLRILVLITTNEALASLHPAVTRPGRCVSEVEFSDLTRDEVAEWFEHHNVEDPAITGRAPLVDLFAEKEKFHNRKAPSKALGFS